MKILYLGNKFYTYKKVNSVLETLEPLLAEFCDIKSASGKKNQFFRCLDFLYYFFRFGLKSDKIIIDVYSTKAFYFAFFLSVLSILFGKKYILFLHGGNLPERYENSQLMVLLMFRFAFKIIAPSPYLQGYFNDKGFKIAHVPNFIELDKYPFFLRGNIRPHLISIRGFGKPYNPIMALKAINELKESISGIKLLMLGNSDDYYYNDVVKYINGNKLQKFISIKPKCTRDEWVNISKDYDIMISTPIIDNTPISLIEGMALGMCIISTNVGGVPYLLKDGIDSLIIENNSVSELVNGIERICHGVNNGRSLSQNARLSAEQYSWDKIKPLWNKLLQD
jgi:glycosyltransferase involved in cell wall biosynthesis